MDSFWRLGSRSSFLKDTSLDITDAKVEHRNKETAKFSDKRN